MGGVGSAGFAGCERGRREGSTGGGEGALWQSSDLVTRFDWIQDPETVLTPIE